MSVTKRAMGLTAAVLAGMVLLAGCGGGTAASPGPAASPSAPAAQDTPAHSVHSSVPIPAASKLRKGERFLELSMPRPYTPAPPAYGTDDYRCFVVDPELTKNTFLTGSQFLPNNPDIVHHAIFFKLEAKDIAEAQALDDEQPGDGWTCFTGTGIGPQQAQLQGAPWLAAWAPGGGESLATAGTGFQMEPGTRIIMQVHYNLLASGGKATASDQSGIRLRLAPASEDIIPLRTRLLVAPIELPCPPGESGKLCDRDLAVFDVMRRFGDEAGFTVAGLNLICTGGKPKPGNTQFCDRVAKTDMVVYAVAGHMHLLGKSIKVEQNPGTSSAKTLLDVPVYNFDDQGSRKLPKPALVKKGDTLRVTCTHDATLRSKLPALKTLQPRYVVWGEGTADEMCLGVVIWGDKRAR